MISSLDDIVLFALFAPAVLEDIRAGAPRHDNEAIHGQLVEIAMNPPPRPRARNVAAFRDSDSFRGTEDASVERWFSAADVPAATAPGLRTTEHQ
jgi:hypothetical protein